jgi:hypothetical protein
VQQAVWRWRWRLVEARHPHLVQGPGGYGTLVQPIYQLLNGKDTSSWGPAEKGALRSAFADRQWTQTRRHQAGFSDTSNCRLCVLAGLCDESEADPRFAGHLVHRILTCPATEHYRQANAPGWILELIGERTQPDGTLDLNSVEVGLLTRAIVRSPAARLDQPPGSESFEWVVRPDPQAVQVEAFVDGSRLDGEHDLCGLCARQGWAIAAYDQNQKLVAAAHGSTPFWAEGIHATELWGLLMATQSFDPGCLLKVDCMAVQTGAKRDERWATSPSRTFARAWGPLCAALADDPGRVVWMPAHCGKEAIGVRQLSNGQLLRRADLTGNDLVDSLAKRAAMRWALPRGQVKFVRTVATRLRQAAMWIGQATAFANHCPMATLAFVPEGEAPRFVRDTDCYRKCGSSGGRKRRVQGGLGPAAPPGEVFVNGEQLFEFDEQVVEYGAPMGRAVARPAACTPQVAAEAARRAKRARTGSLAEAARSSEQLHRWLACRPPVLAPPAVTAVQRMAALVARRAARWLLEAGSA